MGEPVRTCIGCGQKRPQRELVRLGMKEGMVAVDVRRRLAGRGGYICGPQCVEGAVKRKGFGRAFKGQAKWEPEPLRQALQEQLEKRDVTLTAAKGWH